VSQTELAEKLLVLCRARGLTVTTADSCTGGLVAGAITAISGSSEIFERGFVTYSDTAKTELLGVPAGLIGQVGAVSEAVACHMATGALAQARADLAVAVTGIAGPGGGSAAKPVGTVWFGLARRQGGVIARHCLFTGDRSAIRAASVVFALNLLIDGITE
jgi:nicotinamide-nucleotide amidase